MPLDDTGFGRRVEALDKIDGVIDLLATEDRWCKQALIAPDGRRCILGAAQAVDATKLLIPPIRLAIRQVTGREFEQIEAFNDDRATTHPLVMQVLYQARDNIINGVDDRAVRSTAASAAAGWRTLLGRLRGALGRL